MNFNDKKHIIYVALSGGADSTALLLKMIEWRDVRVHGCGDEKNPDFNGKIDRLFFDLNGKMCPNLNGFEERIPGVDGLEGESSDLSGLEGKTFGLSGLEGKKFGLSGLEERISGADGLDGKSSDINGLEDKNSDINGLEDKNFNLEGENPNINDIEIQIVAVHVNHNIRENADRDEKFCRELCEKLGVPLVVKSVDVPEYAKRHKKSLELAARELRYRAFDEVCKEFELSLLYGVATENAHGLPNGVGVHCTLGMDCTSRLECISGLSHRVEINHINKTDCMSETESTLGFPHEVVVENTHGLPNGVGTECMPGTGCILDLSHEFASKNAHGLSHGIAIEHINEIENTSGLTHEVGIENTNETEYTSGLSHDIAEENTHGLKHKIVSEHIIETENMSGLLHEVGIEHINKTEYISKTTHIRGINHIIVTAHTASDNVETVLLNLARGTGLKGLMGIPVRNGNVVRPLLDMTRAEILEYLKSKNQDYITDESNFSLDYTRNKIRHEVIPKFKEINPEFEKTVQRCVANLKTDSDFLEKSADRAVSECENFVSEFMLGRKTIVKNATVYSGLNKYDDAILARIVKRILYKHNFKVNSRQISGVINVIRNDGKFNISDGIYAVVKNGNLFIQILEEKPLRRRGKNCK